MKKKKALIAQGVKGIDEKTSQIIAAGYNPKDTPEMFVKKIINNQKRMQRTIDEYDVKKQKAE